MGAQSDFISDVFVPSERHREQQLKMARTLIELGITPEKAAAMLSIPRPAIPEQALPPETQTLTNVSFSRQRGAV